VRQVAAEIAAGERPLASGAAPQDTRPAAATGLAEGLQHTRCIAPARACRCHSLTILRSLWRSYKRIAAGITKERAYAALPWLVETLARLISVRGAQAAA